MINDSTRAAALGQTQFVTSTPTFSVGGAAATGDYVGTSTAPQSFADAVRDSTQTGMLKSIIITDSTTTAAVAMEIWFFDRTFTAPIDNAAWAISDADALNCIGVVQLAAAKWYASSNNKIFCDDTIALPIKCLATNLFYAPVARGTTPAWATGNLQITLGILLD